MIAPVLTPESRVIIFSKDRPLQLDATLTSLGRHCSDLDTVRVQVLFKASGAKSAASYEQVMREHIAVEFVPETDFRSDLLAMLSGSHLVMFVVDDTVFIRNFSMAEIADTMTDPYILGFSLRLGRNTTYCYSMARPQSLPSFTPLEGQQLKYRWVSAEHDFGYPLEVSSSVYRSDEMLRLFNTLKFKNPNTLECAMAQSIGQFRAGQPWLACWESSRAFSIPVNKVQDTFENRAGENAEYSAEALAAAFENNRRIRTDVFDEFVPKGCHEEVSLQTILQPPLPPLVTIVIPCYNQAQYLADAVTSVGAQTFKNWELVIVNDGSSDATAVVSRDLITLHAGQRIRLIEQPNSGLAAARNAGIAAGVGEYILPLDADDKLAPTFLAKAVRVLRSRPKVGFVYSHIQHFGQQTDLYRLPKFDAETMVHTDNIGCCCSLIRRKVWAQVGGFDAKMKEVQQGYEDWDFWVGCIEAEWAGWCIPEPLFFYRKRGNSMLGNTIEARERLIAMIVLKHRTLYSPERIQRAEAILNNQPPREKPRKILLACTHFWPSVGGLEMIAENLGAWLVRRGHEVSVATLRRADRTFPLYRGMKIIELSPKQIKRNPTPGSHPGLTALVATGEYDACALFADPLNWMLWSFEGQSLPSRTRVIAQPLINASGYETWKDNPRFCARLTALLKKLNHVVALSKSGPVCRFLTKAGVPSTYIPNATQPAACEPADFRQRFKIPSGRPIFLHIANLDPVKNHPALMRSLSKLAGEWQLVMIGHPTENSVYAQQVKALARMDDRFLLIPGMPHEEIASAIAGSDIIVLPSLGEVSPVSILEAMSHGKPWLATPECGAALENAGGIVVPLQDFPETLRKLTSHPALCHQLGGLGLAHWKACFSWDRVGAAWESLLLTGKIEDDFTMPPRIRQEMDSLKTELAKLVLNTESAAPLISVIIPTYNRPERLQEALQSVLSQTCQDFEIIVVNDGGVDVKPVIQNLPAEKSIIYMQHESNRGMSAARNTALQVAKGKYISFLDDDDIFLPNHLEILAGFLEETGQKAAYTDAWCAEEERASDGKYRILRKHIPFSDDWDQEGILRQNSIPVLCFLHDRRLGLAVGKFDEELTTHEDWDYWIRLSRLCQPIHIKQTTCEFRRRVDGSSVTSSRRQDFLRTTRLIYEKHAAHTIEDGKTRRRQRRVLKKLERTLAPKSHRGLSRWLLAMWKK